MSRKSMLVLGVCLFLMVGTIIREYRLIVQEPVFDISEGVVIVQIPKAPIVVLGENPWFEDLILGQASSWFWETEVWTEEDLEVGKLYGFDGGFLARVLEDLVVIEVGGKRLLLFLGTENVPQAFEVAIEYEADFWILWEAGFFSDFPRPSEGVFILNGRKTTQSWEDWAREHQLPLVTLQGRNSVRLVLRDGEWMVFEE